MKNYEKYADKIRERSGDSNFCDDFVIPYIFKPGERCYNMNCGACRMLQLIWLLEEYEESEADWNNVKVDTPVLVRDAEYEAWNRRYFAEYKDGVVYTWTNGRTSWNVNNGKEVTPWKYAKLAESEEGGVR